MESTIYPAFPSHAPSSCMSLEAFAKARYGDVLRFKSRWDELLDETDTRSKTLFSRSSKRPESAFRTAMLLEGTLRSPEDDSESSTHIPIMPMFADPGDEIPIEPERINLELDGMTFHDEAELRRFLIAAPNLQQLSLRRCNISDAALAAIPKVSPFLEKIDLGNANGFSAHGIILLAGKCLKLTAIRLNNCNHLFATKAPAKPPPGGSERPLTAAGRTDGVLSRFAADVSLGLDYGRHYTGRAASAAATSRALSKKSPRGFPLVSEADIRIALAAGFSLNTLMFHALSVAPRRLTEISLSRCSDVDDTLFTALSGQTAGLAPTEELEDAAEAMDGEDAIKARKEKMDAIRRRMGLSVSEADDGGAAHATEKAAAVKTAAPTFYKVITLDIAMSLRSIDLTACNKITDKTLAFIGANCPDLQQFRIALCDQPGISDAGVASIAQGCPRLSVVDLRGCTTLTNSSLVSLAKNCFRMERICLAGVFQVDDAALSVLASSHSAETLVELDLSRCKLITAAAIKNILFKAANLARVTTDGVINVTLTGMTQQEYELLYNTFTSVRFQCRLLTETDTTKGALVPSFQPPPKEERLSSQRVYAKYGSTAAAAKGKKKKK